MKKLLNVLIGPIIFLIFYFVPIAGLEVTIRGAIGLLVWMLLWWILQPVAPAVTALLPILISQLFKIAETSSVLATYFNATVVLLLSANIITLAWTKWGFDRRLALNIMIRVGNKPRQLIAMWFLLAVVLSSMVANAAVAAALFPIVLTTIKAVGIEENDIRTSNYATCALLAVAWGSNVGFGTPLGGAMNLVVVNLIEEFTQREFMYIDWIIRCVPLVAIVAVPMLLLLLSNKMEYDELPGTKEVLRTELDNMGGMNRGEKIGAALFVLAFGLSLARPLFSAVFPTLTANYIFMFAALLCFLIPAENGEPVLTWNYAQPKIKWGVFFLIAGGTALGNIITKSGVGAMVSEALIPVAGKGPLVAIIIFSLLGCFFSNIMTITGCAALIGPIILTTMSGLGYNPVPFLLLCYAACNVSICLPSSGAGPAMVAGYGIDLKKMIRWGLKTIPICLLSVILLGYLMYLCWPGFSSL
ncbi:MAG: SLC13 family permease [Erysipelotrichaceae bacterium]|nr:SLC13 family permease [Erysipelotrichaceae bacterium]